MNAGVTGRYIAYGREDWEEAPSDPRDLTEFFAQRRPYPARVGSIAQIGVQPRLRFGMGEERCLIDPAATSRATIEYLRLVGHILAHYGAASRRETQIIPAFVSLAEGQGIPSARAALQDEEKLRRLTLALSGALIVDAFEHHWDGRTLFNGEYFVGLEQMREHALTRLFDPFLWRESFQATAEYLYGHPDDLAALLPLGPLIDFTGLIPPEDEVLKKWGRITEASLLHRKNDHPDVKWVNWIWEHPAYLAAQDKIRGREREALLTTIAAKLEAATWERSQASAQANAQAMRREPKGERGGPQGGSLAALVGQLDTRLAVSEEGQRREGAFFEAWQQAARTFPYLRPLMSEFTLSLDRAAAMRLKVSRAAIDPYERVLYLNKGNLGTRDLGYVFPLMLLKVALGHHERAAGKDPFLWDKASEILLTGWLAGLLPGVPEWVERFPELEGLPSVEAVYLRLLEWPKKELRKLETLRGPVSSVLTQGELSAAEQADRDAALLGRVREGVELAQALEGASWGLHGAGLERALRARAARPIPWKPAFAEYLQELTPTLQRERTYAKLSRRVRHREEPKAGRRRLRQSDEHNLLILVDTSGSMSNEDLQDALGTIRSTAGALAIHAIRLFACDAQVRDYGWEAPWHAGAQVTLHGGGGTNLDPALRLIAGLTEEGELLPEQPLLIITDGLFQGEVKTSREHAYLLPKGAALGYRTSAPVFHMVREE